MNEAHLHMVVNHFPIIGTILGLGILISGIVLKNNIVKNTAFSLFIVAAVFAFISMATGDGAEHMVKNLPNIGFKIIHEHEEWAEKLAIVLYLLGITSIVGLYMNTKNHPKSSLVSYLVLTIAIIGTLLAIQTGTSGGEVRHTEIRPNTVQTNMNNQNNNENSSEETE